MPEVICGRRVLCEGQQSQSRRRVLCGHSDEQGKTNVNRAYAGADLASECPANSSGFCRSTPLVEAR